VGRLSNARRILDIEAMVGAPGLASDVRSWVTHGVDCSRDSHRFAGASYAFTIDVLELRYRRAGRLVWHLAIVTERWRASPPGAATRDTKWMKLIAGRASDVHAWMSRFRDWGRNATDANPSVHDDD
jgi:hypothetical protein